MARRNRRDVIDEKGTGVYHVWSRTVRRAFLNGVDPQTGRDYSHRKELIERRLEALASLFAIDVCDHDVEENYLHAILRNRPDLVAEWSDDEVARRWLRLVRSDLELKAPPTDEEVERLLADAKRLARARAALSSISEFMAHLKEPIARAANFTDRCTGDFWQGRFGARRLIDRADLLVCSLYVNLNATLAGRVDRPEEARHASFAARHGDDASGDLGRSRSGWLAPLAATGDAYDGVANGRRASNTGFLGLKLGEFRELLAALLRRERTRQTENFADYLPAVKRWGIGVDAWEKTVQATSCRFANERHRMASLRAESLPV